MCDWKSCLGNTGKMKLCGIGFLRCFGILEFFFLIFKLVYQWKAPTPHVRLHAPLVSFYFHSLSRAFERFLGVFDPIIFIVFWFSQNLSPQI